MLQVDLGMDAYPLIPKSRDEFEFILYSCENKRLVAGEILTVLSSHLNNVPDVPSIYDMYYHVVLPDGSTAYLMGCHYDVLFSSLKDNQ